MAKATVKGQGPELFGRGIDLLFGDEAVVSRAASAPLSARLESEQSKASPTDSEATPANQLNVETASSFANGVADGPSFTEADVDQFLRMAAEAFLRVQAQKRQHTLAMQPSRSASLWQA